MIKFLFSGSILSPWSSPSISWISWCRSPTVTPAAPPIHPSIPVPCPGIIRSWQPRRSTSNASSLPSRPTRISTINGQFPFSVGVPVRVQATNVVFPVRATSRLRGIVARRKFTTSSPVANWVYILGGHESQIWVQRTGTAQQGKGIWTKTGGTRRSSFRNLIVI